MKESVPPPSDDSATGVLKEMYQKLDAVVEDVSIKAKVTCRKGCAHCCQLLALAGFAEALLLAEDILDRPDWKTYVDAMKEQAPKLCFEGITEAGYAEKMIPCAFLGEDKTCKVYSARPACCRFFVVISDPELCDLKNRGAIRQVIDLKSLEAEVWKLSGHVAEYAGIPTYTCAPIPIIVLHTMSIIIEVPEDRAYVEKALEGIPNPIDWMKLYAENLDGGASDKKGRLITI